MLKKTFGAMLGLMVLGAIGYGALVLHNNSSAPAPSQQEIAASWERSVSWLMENRERILRDRNPALWWMIAQSVEVTGDNRLQSLYAEFRRDHDAQSSGPIWGAFFTPSKYWGADVPQSAYEGFAPYQQYFLFSLTCGKGMAADSTIVAQHDADFCSSSQPLSPACVTHQMMGFRMQQRVGCDRVPALDEKVAALQGSIETQLTWDPRVVDVYLQRVLMLVDSGAPERVKPRWLQRVLAAQLPDGSWSRLQPLLPLGGGRYFGFSDRLAGVGPVSSDFHTTAQGVWLTSLLLDGNRRSAGRAAQLDQAEEFNRAPIVPRLQAAE